MHILNAFRVVSNSMAAMKNLIDEAAGTKLYEGKVKADCTTSIQHSTNSRSDNKHSN